MNEGTNLEQRLPVMGRIIGLKGHRLPLLALMCFVLFWIQAPLSYGQNIEAADSTQTDEVNPHIRLSDSQEGLLLEQDEITINSLKKGTFTLGIGGFLDENRIRNQEAWSYYILDEKKSQMNIRFSASYFMSDRKAVGLSFRYIRKHNTTLYTDILGDTTLYDERENGYDMNLFYKIHNPIFGSKRVYFIMQPELAYKLTITNTEREYGNVLSLNETRKHRISAGFQVGVLLFPFEGFSLEAKLGPLGVGYSWENYLEEGDNISNSQNFFVHLVPRITSVSFVMTKYFSLRK